MTTPQRNPQLYRSLQTWLDTYSDEELADAERADTIPCPPPAATIPPPESDDRA